MCGFTRDLIVEGYFLSEIVNLKYFSYIQRFLDAVLETGLIGMVSLFPTGGWAVSLIYYDLMYCLATLCEGINLAQRKLQNILVSRLFIDLLQINLTFIIDFRAKNLLVSSKLKVSDKQP